MTLKVAGTVVMAWDRLYGFCIGQLGFVEYELFDFIISLWIVNGPGELYAA